jgi:hypothetical protein
LPSFLNDLELQGQCFACVFLPIFAFSGYNFVIFEWIVCKLQLIIVYDRPSSSPDRPWPSLIFINDIDFECQLLKFSFFALTL